MNWRKLVKKGFTLVELLVVIGIIALLIAILMPALSRARKQALQVSCGSNERQTTYAALAYANDWEEQLPSRWGNSGNVGGGNPIGILSALYRLPVIGFDTATIWDWWTYNVAYPGYNVTPDVTLGGLAFVMRDYLKNDFDIYICPDGWYGRDDMMHKWSGCYGDQYYGPVCSCGSGANCSDGLFNYKTGYLWLPQRALTVAVGSACGQTMDDKAGEISKTASDLPSLLVVADFNYWSDRWYYDCGGVRSACGMGANHIATSYKKLPLVESTCLISVTTPDVIRELDPMMSPLGQNTSRIDARTKWVPFQDMRLFRWSPSFTHFSFGRTGDM